MTRGLNRINASYQTFQRHPGYTHFIGCINGENMDIMEPYLAPITIYFYTVDVSLLVCTGRKADFPRTTYLAPLHLRSAANDTWCCFSDPKSNRATDWQILGLNALAVSAVGVAILT